MSTNDDRIDCDKCGRVIDQTSEAFTSDEENDRDEHIDCDDPHGTFFGHDGMPQTTESLFPTFAGGDILTHARFTPGFEPEGMAIGDTGLSLYVTEDDNGVLHVLIVK
jgi:hypothetical protein